MATGKEPGNSPPNPPESSGRLRDPSGITLLIVDGPHDGITFSGSKDGVTLGRGPGNDVELPLDTGVSGEHCSVRFSTEDGCWILIEDRGRASTNGSWFDGRRIAGPQALSSRDEFVIGATVFRCLPPGSAETFLPDASRIEPDTQKVVRRLDTTAAMGFGAAAAIALRESSRAITDRHLLLGLASVNGSSPVLSHGAGMITTEFLTRRVQPNEYWMGSQAWISQLVRADTSKQTLYADQLITTPRLYRALKLAERQADAFGNEAVTSNDLFYGLFADKTSRLHEWFTIERGDLKRLLAELTRQKTGIVKRPPGPKGTQREPTDSHVAPQPVPKRPVVDPIVVELAGATLRTATKYRFASSEDRHKALKEAVSKVAAGISTDRRPTVLNQLRDCFPVIHCAPADSGEALRHRQRISELESALERASTRSGPSESPIPIQWAEILSVERDVRFDRLPQPDAIAAELIHDLKGFGLAIERFIVGFVAGLMQKGSMTGRLSLPGYQTTIRRTLNLVASGQPPPQDFKPYLAALETWLVATIAAYHSTPEDWFTGYWQKTGPLRIEASVPTKFLNDAKCWNHYKNVVRRISPDLVGDEIQAMVRQKAQEKFKELIAMRGGQ